jgi:hypothetical protein
MTQPLDDRLRTAFRDKAEQIPPVAPPLELAPRSGRATGPARGRGPGDWLTQGQRRLAAGLAAVAAVAIVAVATVVASSQSAPPPKPPAGGPAAKPPPYYVAISFNAARHMIAVVRATGTGAVIARVQVPRSATDFAGVTAAADDRTFVLEATSRGRASRPTFYRLRIDPGARLAADRTRLTPLGLRLPAHGSGVLGMALSPDGKSLALVDGPGAPTANRLVIYNLNTDASHSWVDRGCQNECIIGGSVVPEFMNILSWTADGRQLGFVHLTGTARHPQFRLLYLTATGDNVLADSRPVTLRAAPGVLRGVAPRDTFWPSTLITPDGKSIIVDAQLIQGGSDQGSAPPRPPELLRYSARTGALQAVVGVPPASAGLGSPAQVTWSSPDGSTILVIGFRDSHGAGLLHAGHYTPIPWSAQLLSAAW